MNDYTLKLATYWRNSLADSETTSGVFFGKDAQKLTAVSSELLIAGCIPEELAIPLFADEPEDAASVEVTLRPWVYKARLEHGKSRNRLPAVITPIIGQVQVDRDGRLYPTAFTLMPRDLLEPLDRYSMAIGAQVDLDAFLSVEDAAQFDCSNDIGALSEDQQRTRWAAYLAFCERMFRQVSGSWDWQEDGFERADFGYLQKNESAGSFNRNILGLYDHLRSAHPQSPLFECFAQPQPTPDEDCLPANSLFAERLGHSSDEYALAPAQRDALIHLLAGNDGDVLAVNGPPGTGKTTLLLSVVASLWAKAALAGGEPPVIVASSTNNQAVTNIIKAFGKDFSVGTGPFAGRWLPDIHSFGAYFPSASAEAEMARTFQTKSFYSQLETEEYLKRATEHYLARALAAFPEMHNPSVAEVVSQLQAAIRLRQEQLRAIEQAWADVLTAREALRSLWGGDPLTVRQQLSRQRAELARQRDAAQGDLKRFKYYLAHESLLYTLFGWLGPVAAKRLRLAKLQFDETDTNVQCATSIEGIETLLAARVLELSKDEAHLAQQFQQAENLLRAEERWRSAIAVLPQSASTSAEQTTLGDCDNWADTSLRFEIFLLTTHYWEGRWLLDVTDNLAEILKSRSKKGRKAVESNWRRWMKLTPCVVATFFRLPQEFACSRFQDQGYVSDYVLNFADLLIVDEAGQVLPEVAAPSFALARQALVIGDTLQIEPIWSVPAAVDIGNLVSVGLLPCRASEEHYAAFCNSGRSSANGSVMAVAQSVSRYHYDRDLARGMYLYEHRRCYDSIVEYCNALCYKGKLQPRRGPKPNDGLPGLGYLHIDGICQQGRGGSRINVLEAQTIAEWIQANEPELKKRYHKELWEIVGIITPFGAQTQAIVQACSALGIRTGKGDGEITVGTVHSFQGAERPVVIFSAVYSKHADGEFIDRRDSMLNVAVSRAKDSFLVFGDMYLFGQVPVSKPRGLLAKFLFTDAANELHFHINPRQDLLTARTGLSFLHGAEEHDHFLLETLNTARYQVEIVSPWLRLRWTRESGALDHMAAAVKRGVKVIVYTDLGFNTSASQAQVNDNAVAEFKKALGALRDQQVEVCVVGKVHSKMVMCDGELLANGSFNWLSAQRYGEHKNQEATTVYRGPDIGGELEKCRAILAAALIPETQLKELGLA